MNRLLVIVVFIVIIASVNAWMPTKARSSSSSSSVTMSSTVGRSKSLPFLKQPPQLYGNLPGDVGIDPLGPKIACVAFLV
jgi:hypothetical protein